MTGMVRSIDPLGRIVLPMEMRKSMKGAVNPGASFDIEVVGNKFVLTLLAEEAQRCSACGNEEKEYATFGLIHLCENCVDDVIEKTLK